MNKNKFTVIGIVLTTVILAGVAIFTAIRLYQTRTGPVAPNVPSSKPAAAGTVCGGIAGIICPTGEECIYSNGTTNAPNPDASGTCQVIDNSKIACSLSFTLTTSSPTPTATPTRTPTATPTATATATATATPVPQCNSVCSTTSDCPSNLTCYKANGATSGNCRNTQCTTAANCVCATTTPTATPTATATATSTSTATSTATATANPQCNSACTSNSNCPSSMICYIPSGSTAGNCRNTQCLSETDCICAVATATDQPTLPEVGTTWPTLLGTGFGILVILGSLLLAL